MTMAGTVGNTDGTGAQRRLGSLARREVIPNVETRPALVEITLRTQFLWLWLSAVYAPSGRCPLAPERALPRAGLPELPGTADCGLRAKAEGPDCYSNAGATARDEFSPIRGPTFLGCGHAAIGYNKVPLRSWETVETLP